MPDNAIPTDKSSIMYKIIPISGSINIHLCYFRYRTYVSVTHNSSEILICIAFFYILKMIFRTQMNLSGPLNICRVLTAHFFPYFSGIFWSGVTPQNLVLALPQIQPFLPHIFSSMFCMALQILLPALAPLQMIQYFSQNTGDL